MTNIDMTQLLTAEGKAAAAITAARDAAVLDRFEFAMAAAQARFITFDEAAQWAAGNAMPAAVEAVLDKLSSDEKGPATLDVLARPAIRRNGNLMTAIAAAFGTDDAGLDALFGID